LWPNTRIPRSETTGMANLENCCIIEVDLDSIEESVEDIESSTRYILLLDDTIVGQLTRKAILFITL
jgi:hypothetical protein